MGYKDFPTYFFLLVTMPGTLLHKEISVLFQIISCGNSITSCGTFLKVYVVLCQALHIIEEEIPILSRDNAWYIVVYFFKH